MWKSFASRSQVLSWTWEKRPNFYSWVTVRMLGGDAETGVRVLILTPELVVGFLHWSQMLQNLRFIIQKYVPKLILFS